MPLAWHPGLVSTPPPTFENYPPAWDADVRSTEGAGPAGTSAVAPRPAVPGPPSPPPPGQDRRSVLLMIGGGALALVAVSVVARNMTDAPNGDPGGAASEEPEPPEPENATELGDYTVSWPDGWTVDGATELQVVLVQGEVTVVFRAYSAGGDATAAEEAQRLLNRHTAGLGKRRTGATSTRSGLVETASIEASGVRGDGVRVDTTVHVVIEPEDQRDALAVIAQVPSGTPAARRQEIDRMRRDFLEQLG